MRLCLALLLCCCQLISAAQLVKPYGPIPNLQQLKWHEMEYYLFVHFGPNTFSDMEWGHGTEDPKIFHPTQLDCRQWARIARDAGAKGIIITAKHHDGFCLWPSKYSKHSVRESNWKDGKGDVIRELADACASFGIKFGVYISPWDRNHPQYGTDAYNDVYVNTMTELLTNYGELFELWWDGANGEGPNGKKQVYDFRRFENVARKLAPKTVIFSDIGPDIRWVGNEKGFAGTTNWNLLDTVGFKRGEGAPPTDTLNQGNVNGRQWLPAECDVSIRPGWFYHAKEDTAVKSGRELMKLYLKSVGRGATLLLNVPPDRRGLIHEADSAALMSFKQLRQEYFKENLAWRVPVTVSASRPGFLPMVMTDEFRFSYWVTPAGVDTVSIELDLGAMKSFNTILLQEYIELGQRIKSFTVQVDDGYGYKPVASGTTIGYKRILQFPEVYARKVKVTITDSKAPPTLSVIHVFDCPELLVLD